METNQYPQSVIVESGVDQLVLPASIAQRFAAGAVDIVITFSCIYLIPIIGALLSVAYYLNKDALPFLKGQSVGKKLFQIRVITKDDHSSIEGSYSISILRSITIFIPLFNFFETVVLLVGQDRFGDKWAGTIVVKDNPQLMEIE